MIHPLTNRPEPKKSFLPSLWERKKVIRMVKAIKAGSLKPIKKPDKPSFYMLWSDTDSGKVDSFLVTSTIKPLMHIYLLFPRMISSALINSYQLLKPVYQVMLNRIILHQSSFPPIRGYIHLSTTVISHLIFMLFFSERKCQAEFLYTNPVIHSMSICVYDDL